MSQTGFAEQNQTAAASEGQKQTPERRQVSGKRYNIVTDRKTTKINDVEGHYVTITEYKGVNIKNQAQVYSTIVSDTVKGNGNYYGYFKGVGRGGATYYGESEGEITTVVSPSGKSVTTSEGTWTITEFKMGEQNIGGSGTYRSKVIGPGVSKMLFKGEMWQKK